MKLALCLPVAALLALTSPAAFAAEGLDCMDAAFSDQQQQSFSRFAAGFDIVKIDDMPLPDDLIVAVAERADLCRGRHGWSEQAMEQAVLHFTAGLLDKLIEYDAPFSAKEWAGLKTAYQTIDKAMVRQLVEPILADGEPDTDASAASDLYFGEFFGRTGIAEENGKAEAVGAWVGAQGMLEMSAERFTAY